MIVMRTFALSVFALRAVVYGAFIRQMACASESEYWSAHRGTMKDAASIELTKTNSAIK